MTLPIFFSLLHFVPPPFRLPVMPIGLIIPKACTVSPLSTPPPLQHTYSYTPLTVASLLFDCDPQLHTHHWDGQEDEGSREEAKEGAGTERKGIVEMQKQKDECVKGDFGGRGDLTQHLLHHTACSLLPLAHLHLSFCPPVQFKMTSLQFTKGFQTAITLSRWVIRFTRRSL